MTRMTNAAAVAQAHNLSARRIRILCAQGRVQGAVKIGRDWMIPTNRNGRATILPPRKES